MPDWQGHLCCFPRVYRVPVRSLNDKELVGKQFFFDESLSEPAGQSCAPAMNRRKGFARYIRTDHFGRGRERLVQATGTPSSRSYVAYVPALYPMTKKKKPMWAACSWTAG
ncbi:MAG: hypothetical protein V8T12_12125 [Parabacteroides johnsonii]